MVSANTPGLVLEVFDTSTSRFTRELFNHSLPLECHPGPHTNFSRCAVLKHQGHLIVPSNGSLLLVNLDSVAAPPTVVPVSSDWNCHPTRAVFDPIFQSFLWVECVSDVNRSLEHLRFILSTVDGEITLTHQPLPSNRVLFSESLSPGRISESILVSRESCSISHDSLYTVVDDRIWYFPITFGSTHRFSHSAVRLQDCPGVSYLEHTTGSEHFTVHCSNGVSIRYNICEDTVDSSFYRFSCSLDANVVFSPAGSIRVEGGVAPHVLNHSLSGILYGSCCGDFFTVITTEGSLEVVDLRTGVVTTVVRDVCGSSVCLRPAAFVGTAGDGGEGEGGGFLAYDSGGSIVSVQPVERCEGLVVEIYANSSVLSPSILAVTGEAGVRACPRCEGIGSTTEVTTTEEVHSPPPTTILEDSRDTPPNTSGDLNATAAEPVTTADDREVVNRLKIARVAAGSAVGAVFIMVVIVVLVLAAVFACR